MNDDSAGRASGPGNGVYDLAVIGAGSAGFSAAITAAEQSARVALIGHGLIGGTCVNVGCVPSKTMIRAAEALHGAGAVRRFPGLSGAAEVDDWAALMAGKEAIVTALRQKKYAHLLPGYETITYIDDGLAELTEGGVKIAGEMIGSPKIVITTGARPILLPIPGIEVVPTLDSTSLLALESLPESLVFLGGGYVGAELAQMMARMGVKVTVVCRSRLLPEVEPEISEALTAVFRDEGIRMHCGITYDACRKGPVLCIEDGGKKLELSADNLVVATGRAPNTEGLGLERMSIATDERGAIIVGDDMQTTRPDVYAAGDVTNRDQFVYMAAYGAKLAALNALNGNSRLYDNSAMPWVVFTESAGSRGGLQRGSGA